MVRYFFVLIDTGDDRKRQVSLFLCTLPVTKRHYLDNRCLSRSCCPTRPSYHHRRSGRHLLQTPEDRAGSRTLWKQRRDFTEPLQHSRLSTRRIRKGQSVQQTSTE